METPKYPVGYLKSSFNLDGTRVTANHTIIADGDEELPCNGQMVSKEKYPVLYEVLRDWWADYGSTETEFMIPDLRGRPTL